MFLGLDLGTTNVKALVVDRAGRPISRGSCPVDLFRLPGGGVEQDIQQIWQATIAAIQQALSPIEPSAIEGVGISSQGGAMQVLDRSGNPLGRVISWLDQRGQPFDDGLNAEFGRDWFLKRIVHGGSWLAIGQLLRLRQEQPGLLNSPNRIGFVGDIIAGRLCGRQAQDGTSAALTLLYNPATRTYDPGLLARLGLSSDQLPVLLSAREPAGRLLQSVGGTIGLPPGIPISAAIHDQYASALGTGAVRAGTVMVGTGTAWVLLAVGDCLPVPIHNHALVCHHLIDGLWGQILSMVNGGSALSWAMEMTGAATPQTNQIDLLLEGAPPGSNGVGFWPFMTPFGGFGLEPGTTGRFSGLQLSHRRPHMIRAVVEGLAYELSRHLNIVRNSGHAVDRIVMGGGAAGSRVTPQMVADITGLPLSCFSGSEASLLGATIIARGLLEPTAHLSGLVETLLPTPLEVEPGPGSAFYQDQFQKYLTSLPVLRETLP